MDKFISEMKNSFERLSQKKEEVYIMAQCTNKLTIDRFSRAEPELENVFKYGIDVRMFNAEGEIKWFRAAIHEPFMVREKMNDSELEKDVDYWEEEQYLDIDTTKSHLNRVFATGGGEYSLPIENLDDAMVKIRNYVEYDKESGRAYVVDWRIVEFVEGRR